MSGRNLKERLGREWLFCDGGTGSFLQGRGLKPGELPETWNLTHPDDVSALAEAYFSAGSDIVNTNTFGANALKYPTDLEAIVRAGVRLAKAGRAAAGRDADGYVALDMGPTGKLLEPMGDLAFERAVSLYGEVARIGTDEGADLILIETMSDTLEAKAAVLGAKENSDLPVFVTVTFDEKGKLLTGGDVPTVVAMLEGLRVDALGMNCGMGPAQMLPIVREFVRYASVPVIVNPNAGLPRVEGAQTVYDIGPDEFARCMRKIAECGVQILGGCCGTTPEHIRSEIASCRDVPFSAPSEKTGTFVTSFSRAVEIGPRPVLIGERINPTGKKRFQEALIKGDLDEILTLGIAQEEAGAHILDVNVGLPDVDEALRMRQVVQRLQAVTPLPLQIDTSDPKALEAGLRIYNGKPMVNSASGKEEELDAVMPLVRKYGGVLVALALDADGIPESAEGRIAVARRVYEAADRYGIPRKDIVIDALSMAVSSEPDSANVTLETLRRIRNELHGRSVLGISNVSFGLPERKLINSTFLLLALQAGLDCAIVNPNSEPVMRAVRTFEALSGLDPHLGNFISAYSGSVERNTSGASGGTAQHGRAAGAGSPDGRAEVTLTDSVLRGLPERAKEAAKKRLKDADPMEIIDSELIPALDRVGKGFEDGSVFLPQLLMAAEAAQAAFGVIRDSLAGNTQESRGRVVLATVRNDIHDIGKNIVKVLLENYGYEVLDLGKDVPPETIVDCAVQNDIRLVGLSALMTTTVTSMEETIRLLREKKPDAKTVVGGAVLTPEYADAIGADAYARDAMETVRFADRVFGEEQPREGG